MDRSDIDVPFRAQARCGEDVWSRWTLATRMQPGDEEYENPEKQVEDGLGFAHLCKEI